VREFYFDNKKVKIARKIKPPKPRRSYIPSLTACEYVLKYDFSTKTIHRAETIQIWKIMRYRICYSSLLYDDPKFQIYTSPENDPSQYYDLVYEKPNFLSMEVLPANEFSTAVTIDWRNDSPNQSDRCAVIAKNSLFLVIKALQCRMTIQFNDFLAEMLGFKQMKLEDLTRRRKITWKLIGGIYVIKVLDSFEIPMFAANDLRIPVFRKMLDLPKDVKIEKGTVCVSKKYSLVNVIHDLDETVTCNKM
jgi:hypothetical protein